ncbi:hypothetical protein PanWU01x14_185140 [Parasponia andersonii]|uniref:Uncharacterized protein n=1 Tax=Parasponia andersonii TaxID=3476 RepID=A0A2P5C479_PARAD|nr:hypothetical protein PanWU01x14_185140 [Parasponia andersonii]
MLLTWRRHILKCLTKWIPRHGGIFVTFPTLQSLGLEISERNATNRARQLAVSKQGVASIAHIRYKKNKILKIQNTLSQASSHSSSSSSTSVTDAHIAYEVLGTRRRFRRGVGRRLSKFASSTRSAPPDFPPPVPEDVQ